MLGFLYRTLLGSIHLCKCFSHKPPVSWTELILVLTLLSNVSVPHRLIPTGAHATLATVMDESIGFPKKAKNISWRALEDKLHFRLQFQEKYSPSSGGRTLAPEIWTRRLSLSQSLSFFWSNLLANPDQATDWLTNLSSFVQSLPSLWNNGSPATTGHLDSLSLLWVLCK